MIRRFLNAFDYSRWLAFAVRRPWTVILLVLLVTILLGVRLPRLAIHATSYEVAIKDIPSYKAYQSFLTEFGGGEYIQVIAKGKYVFDPRVFAKLGELADQFEQIPGVIKVISLPGAKKDMDLLDEWSVEEFSHILAPVKLFEKNIISPDRQKTAFTLLIDDITQEESIVKAVNRIIEKEKEKGSGLTMYAIGMPLVSQSLLACIQRDFSALPPITFLVMVLVLLLVFKSVRAVLPSVFCLMGSLIWTFGVMAWTDTPVSSLTLVVPVFLLAVGTAYCLHVTASYYEAAANAESSAEAAEKSLNDMRLPTTLAVFTTVLGLSTLVINPTQTIREFAIPACIGMFSILILIFFLFPAMLALVPLPKKKYKEAGGETLGRFLARVARLDIAHQRPLFAVLGLILIVSLLGLFRLRIDADITKYFRESEPVAQNFHQVYKDMSGSFPVNVIVDADKPDYFMQPANLKKLGALQEYLESLPGIDKTVSFADYIKVINYSVNEHKPEYYSLNMDAAEVPNLLNLYRMVMGPDLSRRFMKDDLSKAGILVMMHISSAFDWLTTEKEIRDYCAKTFANDFSVDLTSMGIIVAHSNRIVTANLINSLFMIIAVIFVMMAVMFLSARAGLMTLLPNVFPLVVVFGIMGWLRYELSMNTAMIATIAIGLALDDTVHYMVRYDREFRKDLNPQRALTATISTVGRPMVLYTITVCLGFSILLFSSLKPTAIFGGLMAATMAAALAGDLLLLPSLMLHVELTTVWDLLRVRMGKSLKDEMPIFAGLSRGQIRSLLSMGAIREFAPEQELLAEEDRADSIYAVISGEVALYQSGSDPEDCSGRVRVATLRPGDVMGGSGTTRWHGPSARLVAKTPVEILEISSRTLKRLQWMYPPTAYRFVINLTNILAQRLERTIASLAQENGFRRDVTGLINPITFKTCLENEMARVRRYGGKCAVLVLEVENLYDLARSHGFPAADQALAAMAETLKAQLRSFDTICRIDETRFALLLVNAGAPEAQAVQNRLLAAVASLHDGREFSALRISAGFSSYGGDDPSTAAAMLDEAARCLLPATQS
ncbi:MAG: MMPL family transporter [Thermodesulfobacteriota bacterium]